MSRSALIVVLQLLGKFGNSCSAETLVTPAGRFFTPGASTISSWTHHNKQSLDHTKSGVQGTTPTTSTECFVHVMCSSVYVCMHVFLSKSMWSGPKLLMYSFFVGNLGNPPLVNLPLIVLYHVCWQPNEEFDIQRERERQREREHDLSSSSLSSSSKSAITIISLLPRTQLYYNRLYFA